MEVSRAVCRRAPAKHAAAHHAQRHALQILRQHVSGHRAPHARDLARIRLNDCERCGKPASDDCENDLHRHNREVLQSIITGIFGGAIGGITKGTPTFDFSANVPNHLAGGMPNMAYMVGEMGKEFFVPRTAGTIVPNDRLGGARACR